MFELIISSCKTDFILDPHKLKPGPRFIILEPWSPTAGTHKGPCSLEPGPCVTKLNHGPSRLES